MVSFDVSLKVELCCYGYYLYCLRAKELKCLGLILLIHSKSFNQLLNYNHFKWIFINMYQSVLSRVVFISCTIFLPLTMTVPVLACCMTALGRLLKWVFCNEGVRRGRYAVLGRMKPADAPFIQLRLFGWSFCTSYIALVYLPQPAAPSCDKGKPVAPGY